ncbi:MAG: hypothetical protein FJW63_08815 [Actinobacteria bacterium]|nr:hypothetical protein [Actinomycetota bacterium]
MSEKIPKTKLILFVLILVILNLFAAVLMKILSLINIENYFVIVLGVITVMIINLFRLIVWYHANKQFNLNIIYPLTSIYYPLVLFVSYFFNEKITFIQIIGTIFIMSGVFWLGCKTNYMEV